MSLPKQFYEVAENGCWKWQRSINDQGYGTWWQGGHTYRRAHVASYEIHVGPVPSGMVLDHVCRNRACVNPDHLEPVTNRENVLRGIGPSAINARKRKCVHGHEFTPENTRIRPDGSRLCRACKNDWQRAHRLAAWIARTP